MNNVGIDEFLPRQARPFIGSEPGRSESFGDGPGSYLDDPRFAPGYHSLVRAGAVLDRELDLLFDFIEPCDENQHCFSHRTFGLLGRSAMEVEALLSLSLEAAGIEPAGGKPNMSDYKELEDDLRLSEYKVRLPIWSGVASEFQPFRQWSGELEERGKLDWWRCYTDTKHHRVEHFARATMRAAVEAAGAALICLFAQVAGRALDASSDIFGAYIADQDGWITGDRLFEILPPVWPEDDKYRFDPKAR